MKLSINKDALTIAVSTVCKAISNRTTLPVLENIFIQFENDMITFRGNDLELGIEYKLPIETPGEQLNNQLILVKADTLNEILTKIKSETIDLELDDNYKLNIKTSNIDFEIYGMSPDQYPQFPEIEREISFELKSSDLLSLIKYTIFSVSHDETKQFLNGIKIETKGNRCDFISTDGFRLSTKYEEFESDIPEFSCIVPFKTMNEVFKILTSLKTERIKVFISERQITFEIENCNIISRLINGRFPDYKQVLTKNSAFEFKIEKNLLLHALERANIISSKCNNVARFNFTETNVVISATSPKLGEYVESLALNRNVGDRDIMISFNIKLLQEVLKIIEQNEVIIEINSELSPCVVNPIGDSTYTHILMPIRMSDFSSTEDTDENDTSDNKSKVEEEVVA